MKRLKQILLPVLLCFLVCSAKAQSSLGGRLGFDQYNGFVAVSYKTEFKSSALELNGAINMSADWLGFMADYYFFERRLDFDTPGTWQWYTGAGGQLWVGDGGFVIGPDGKLGMEYKFEDAPIETFLDLALFLGISSDNSDFGFQLGLGMRVPF